MAELKIRGARERDIPRMQEIFEMAKQRMRAEGNLTQWKNYPKDELLRLDIDRMRSFVVTDDDEIVATFVYMLGVEPTYRYIEDGAWLNDEDYGTIHRIATDGKHKGILKLATEFALRHVRNVRIDTDEKNVSMRAALEKLGYVRCGIIYVADANGDHEPRIAYQLVGE